MLMGETVNAVPFGEDNAITAHCVWNRIRSFAEASVRHNLDTLASSGAIRCSEHINADGKRIALYWRQS